MRLTLSLAAALLLVGAGCSANTTVDTTTETVPNNAAGTVETGSNVVVNADDTPATNTESGAATGGVVTVSSTVTVPTVKAEAKVEEKKPVETKPVETKPEEKPAEKPIEPPAPTGPKTYTMADVSAQTAAGQCWTVINNNVYNLTAWIEKHPGGAGAIKSLCGINGTAKFTAMHGGAAKQEAILATFLVGPLK